MTREKLADYLAGLPPEIVFRVTLKGFDYVLIGYPVLRILGKVLNSYMDTDAIIKLNTDEVIIHQGQMRRNRDAFNLFDDPVLTQTEIEFIQTIPQPVRDKVRVFSDSHWELLNSYAYCGNNFDQLVRSNPALAYIAANMEKFNPTYSLINSLRSTESFMKRGRRDVLKAALFPHTNRVERMLRKVDPSSVNVQRLFVLRAMLSNPDSQRKIYPVIDGGVYLGDAFFNILLKAGEYFRFCSPSLITKLVQSDEIESAVRSLHRIQSLAKKLDIPVLPLRSIGAIEKTMQQLEVKYDERNRFPSPPLPGTSTIIPLTSPEEMIEWSRAQKNCIGKLWRKVINRKSYFYKIVTDKENATLEILQKGSEMKMGDLLGTSNKAVSDETRMMVLRWFQENSACGKS